jgi:uncharacterized membrane protein
MLILHFIGLAMGLGTSFAFMFLGIAASKMEKTESEKFRLNSFAISRMGHIGLTLLIISGGYLMTPYWSSLSSSPLLIAKLVLVLLLAALIGIISSKAKKAKKGDAEIQLKKMEPLGKIAMITALTIVVLAVYVFH